MTNIIDATFDTSNSHDIIYVFQIVSRKYKPSQNLTPIAIKRPHSSDNSLFRGVWPFLSAGQAGCNLYCSAVPLIYLCISTFVRFYCKRSAHKLNAQLEAIYERISFIRISRLCIKILQCAETLYIIICHFVFKVFSFSNNFFIDIFNFISSIAATLIP